MESTNVNIPYQRHRRTSVFGSQVNSDILLLADESISSSTSSSTFDDPVKASIEDRKKRKRQEAPGRHFSTHVGCLEPISATSESQELELLPQIENISISSKVVVVEPKSSLLKEKRIVDLVRLLWHATRSESNSYIVEKEYVVLNKLLYKTLVGGTTTSKGNEGHYSSKYSNEIAKEDWKADCKKDTMDFDTFTKAITQLCETWSDKNSRVGFLSGVVERIIHPVTKKFLSLHEVLRAGEAVDELPLREVIFRIMKMVDSDGSWEMNPMLAKILKLTSSNNCSRYATTEMVLNFLQNNTEEILQKGKLHHTRRESHQWSNQLSISKLYLHRHRGERSRAIQTQRLEQERAEKTAFVNDKLRRIEHRMSSRSVENVKSFLREFLECVSYSQQALFLSSVVSIANDAIECILKALVKSEDQLTIQYVVQNTFSKTHMTELLFMVGTSGGKRCSQLASAAKDMMNEQARSDFFNCILSTTITELQPLVNFISYNGSYDECQQYALRNLTSHHSPVDVRMWKNTVSCLIDYMDPFSRAELLRTQPTKSLLAVRKRLESSQHHHGTSNEREGGGNGGAKVTLTFGSKKYKSTAYYDKYGAFEDSEWCDGNNPIVDYQGSSVLSVIENMTKTDAAGPVMSTSSSSNSSSTLIQPMKEFEGLPSENTSCVKPIELKKKKVLSSPKKHGKVVTNPPPVSKSATTKKAVAVTDYLRFEKQGDSSEGSNSSSVDKILEGKLQSTQPYVFEQSIRWEQSEPRYGLADASPVPAKSTLLKSLTHDQNFHISASHERTDAKPLVPLVSKPKALHTKPIGDRSRWYGCNSSSGTATMNSSAADQLLQDEDEDIVPSSNNNVSRGLYSHHHHHNNNLHLAASMGMPVATSTGFYNHRPINHHFASSMMISTSSTFPSVVVNTEPSLSTQLLAAHEVPISNTVHHHTHHQVAAASSSMMNCFAYTSTTTATHGISSSLISVPTPTIPMLPSSTSLQVNNGLDTQSSSTELRGTNNNITQRSTKDASTCTSLENKKSSVASAIPRKFKCTVEGCEASFSVKNDLKRHLRTHTGERPFPCTYPRCNKRFTQRSAQRRHMKSVHDRVRQYQCTYGCGKEFSTITARNRHELQHSGVRPYVCKYESCNQRFASTTALKYHIRKHEKDLRAKTNSEQSSDSPD